MITRINHRTKANRMTVLVRYSEIGLKGKNRVMFERKLVDNIRSALAKRKIKVSSIKRPRGRIIVETESSCDCLGCVFGISSFSPAVEAGTTLESAKKTSEKLIRKLARKTTFRVSCQRLDKQFAIRSSEMERELGAFVVEKKGAKVKLKGFEFELGAEIIDGNIYLFTRRIPGQGGLPLGSSGKVIALIESKEDVLAALLAMKRGCSVIPVIKESAFAALTSSGFFSLPCASEGEKKRSLEGQDRQRKKGSCLIEKYGNREKPVKIKKISEIDNIARKKGAKAVVVGQTVDGIKELKLKTNTLRPLVALNKNEIRKQIEGFRKKVCQ